MAECKIRAGIFTLKPCGRTVEGYCAKCGKGACGKHSRLVEAKSVCVECAVAENLGAVREDDVEMARMQTSLEVDTTGYSRYTSLDYQAFSDTAGGEDLAGDSISPGAFLDS